MNQSGLDFKVIGKIFIIAGVIGIGAWLGIASLISHQDWTGLTRIGMLLVNTTLLFPFLAVTGYLVAKKFKDKAIGSEFSKQWGIYCLAPITVYFLLTVGVVAAFPRAKWLPLPEAFLGLLMCLYGLWAISRPTAEELKAQPPENL